MFFPEHLLSRSGPLARVWLAANLEKKLSKNQVLQDKIDQDISVIVRPEVAGGPMALRLSGQLLLGVVRIYSRKARYLLDDCTEALMKIKMAFRPGNIDLPANQSHIANPKALVLPDAITDIDLLAPMPDPAFLLSGIEGLPDHIGLDDTTVADWDNSQFLSGSMEQPRAEPTLLEDAPELDLDWDGVEGFDEGTSIERGRDAPLERRLSEELASSPKLLPDDDLGLDFGGDDDTTAMPGLGATDLNLGLDGGMDMTMGGMSDLDLPEVTLDEVQAENAARQRDSLSPLSDIRSSVERELEQTYNDQHNQTAELQEDEESVHHAQRAKRRRILHADAETELSNAAIREHQNHRDKILKPASFLPRDPMLLALLNMQKSGGFVSSILGDGRSRGWAPELRGILSLEVVSRPQKRKRDGATAQAEEQSHEPTPQLEFEQSELNIDDANAGLGMDDTLANNDEQIINLPSDDAHAHHNQDDNPLFPDDEETPDNFDDTTAPLLHPADSGPVSVGTKHAVHLLRERFGADAETSESQRAKASVLFQDMLPENSTTKAEATKMFFEVLVLATKDAIKVEQSVDELGGPLRIRGKRGLWGSWAETSAGGELASQTEVEARTAVEAAA